MSFVYAIKCGPYFKIGKADDVENRVRQLQAGNPKTLTVATTLEVDSDAAYFVERAVHRLLADTAHQGEWFRTKISDIKKAMKEAKKMSDDNHHLFPVPNKPLQRGDEGGAATKALRHQLSLGQLQP